MPGRPLPEDALFPDYERKHLPENETPRLPPTVATPAASAPLEKSGNSPAPKASTKRPADDEDVRHPAKRRVCVNASSDDDGGDGSGGGGASAELSAPAGGGRACSQAALVSSDKMR